MMKLALLFVCLSYQITDCIGAPTDLPECEECTEIAIISINTITENLKRLEPMAIGPLIPPCTNCKATGLSSMILTEGVDTCSFKIDSGNRIAFALTVPSFTLTCTCEIPCSPMEFAKEFADPVIKMSQCAPEINAEGLKTAISGDYSPVRSEDILKIASCVFDVGANMECNDVGTLTNTVELIWSNTTITLNSFVNSKNKVYRLSDLAIKNFTLNSATCAKGDPKFERSCGCLLATNFGRNTLVAALTMAVGCNVKSNKNLPKEAYYLTCIN